MSEEFTVHSKKNYAKKATSGILVIIIGVVLVFLAINMIVRTSQPSWYPLQCAIGRCQ